MNELLSSQELLEHYKHSKHRGTLASPSFVCADYNPSCGDRICFQAALSDGIVTDLKFEGSGCIISQASASLLAEYFSGKDIEAILNFSKDDFLTMVGLSLGPNRVKCVLLALFTLQEGVKSYKKGNDHDRN